MVKRSIELESLHTNCLSSTQLQLVKKVFASPPTFPIAQVSRTITFYLVRQNQIELAVHVTDGYDFENLGLARSDLDDVYSVIDIVGWTEWALKVRTNTSKVNDDVSPHEESTPLVGV
eukprot:scaffold685_cov191-Alexandrium_tamarense.AAC.6